jgi:hypothetical protein
VGAIGPGNIGPGPCMGVGLGEGTGL